ncbi:segregation and condensation protein A [Georgenia thermotolerans]|uniref:Segregation and condensation protein A n=1 Tax=Georgenia thermotolerans TaxID=527326 RepID=A0A7J5UUA2_9MICO|nr:ScpA family protein [Georgenia thermotolerans]KAE8765856.1 segregation/condensation protein A [Georgenia thermotolerans]
MATRPDATTTAPAPTGARAFELQLENFSGPFDLLLSLIAKHRLDITEVALAQVTDEFIAYISAQSEWDLGQASEFLVIAATLLDLKAARLLPRGTVDDEDDLELLEARDLLFARLLQYRAFKEVAEHLEERWAAQGKSYPRSVPLEPHLAALLPELVMQVGPDELARLAAGAFAPKPGAPQVDIAHVHDPVVPVREQAALIVEKLRRLRTATFRALTADAASTAVVVARFLALLELFRERAVAFDQPEPLGELTIRWSGAEEGEVAVGDEYDGDPASPADLAPAPGAGEPDGAVDPAAAVAADLVPAHPAEDRP